MSNPCYNPCPPDETTQEAVPCTDGEKCGLILDLDCVVYTGEDKPEIGIRKGDRGSKILDLLNQNHTSTGIRVEDTNTVDLEGFGTEADKLKANVKTSSNTDNLITKESDGLLVKFTPENVLKLLTLIKNTPDLKDEFCNMLHECNSCNLITDFTVDIT